MNTAEGFSFLQSQFIVNGKELVMLSQRLKRIANYLKDPIIFADIGSDHAYLPTYVCQHDKSARAIAGELNKGPYERALQTVQENELDDRIQVRQGDGLEIIHHNDKVNQVVIAGMGGKLIKKILEEGKQKLEHVSRVVLQPNVDAPFVRQWLHHHQFQITDEEIIEEDGYIYELIVADKVDKPVELNGKATLFGPYLLENKTDVFYLKWQSELEKRERLVNQMKQANVRPEEKIKQLRQEIEWIKEALDHDNS